MAFKIDTNALVLAQKVQSKITVESLMNAGQGAIGNVYEGEDGPATAAFCQYVKDNYLSGQAMNESMPDGNHDSWLHYVKRGWHHNTTVKIHRSRRARRGVVEMTIGMYDPKSMQYSLNYILKNLRATGNERCLTRAWSKYKGAKRVKEELAWVYDKMLDKIFREENGAQ